MKTHNVTRVELIDQHDRVVTKRVNRGSVNCVLQDDDRTLKIFVNTQDEDDDDTHELAREYYRNIARNTN